MHRLDDDIYSYNCISGSTPNSSFYHKTSSKPYSKGVVNPYYASTVNDDETTAANSVEFNVITKNQDKPSEDNDGSNENNSPSDKFPNPIANETSSDSGLEYNYNNQ